MSGVAGSDGVPLVGYFCLATGVDKPGVRLPAVGADVQVPAPGEATPATVKVAADLLCGWLCQGGGAWWELGWNSPKVWICVMGAGWRFVIL